MSEPSLNVWIARIEGLRNSDPLIARGQWRGYKQDDVAGNDPLKGRFVMGRWTKPSVVVASDDPGQCVELARTIEGVLP
jgi:hypothetical protein